jgi:methionyl aminopeptidase
VKIARHSPAQIEQMKPAGVFVAQVLTALEEAAAPGMNLLELDALAGQMIAQAGATSCYVDYHPSFGGSPFGKVLCTSVNDAALHGLPHDYPLQSGDLLSLDFAVSLHGWVADSALSITIGEGTPEDRRLIEATRVALEAGISRARAGNRLGDISHAIGQIARECGYPVNEDFGGHGVGRTMHEEPSVPNNGEAGTGPRLRPGMVFAIEPWFMASTDAIVTDRDGWTLRSMDGSRSAHSEHTVAITADGPLVLTRRPGETPGV